jgi:tetratricopeptide (TPR) repeat protein
VAPVHAASSDGGDGGTTNAPAAAAAPAEGADADVLRGLAEHLRMWIGEHHEAVVDMERTAQALALLGDQSTSGTPAPEQLHESIGARTVVGMRWEVAPGGTGHIAFDVYRSEQPTVTVQGSSQPAAEIVESYRDGALALLSELRLGSDDAPVDLPEQRRALASFGQGLRERSHGDPAAAVQRFNEATGAAPGFTPAWLALAESARAAGRGDAALTAALNGLRLVDSTESAHAMRLEALRASIEGDPDRAATVLGWLAARRPGDTQVALLLAEAQAEAGRFQEAAERLQVIAEMDADDPRVWFLLGKVSILRGEARRAVDEYLVRALVLFNRSRNAAGQADTINALGVGYDRLGQVDQAIEQYGRAVELRRTLGDPRGLASSLRNLAALAAVRGEFDLAETHLAEARSLLEELRDRQGLADLDNDLGLLAEERGDFAAALQHYRAALQQRQSIGHAHGVAESLNNVGFSHYQLGAYDDALVYWRQALDSFEALGDLSGVVRSRQNLAVLDIARGNWGEAHTALGATLVQAEREQMVEEAAVSLRYLAELALLRGDPVEARGTLDRAERLFSGRDDQRGLLDVALLRVRAALLDGAPPDGDRLDSVPLGGVRQPPAGTEGSGRATALLEPLLDRLETLSVAQRVEVLLLATDAVLRAGDHEAAAALSRRTTPLAGQAGVPLHEVHARVLASALPGATGSAGEALAAAERLGNVPLLLRAQEIALAQALAPGAQDPAAALAHYRDALGVLRRVGTYAHARELHRSGALAAELAGDADAAREARIAEAAAQARP